MARSVHEGRTRPAHPDDIRTGLREAATRRADAQQEAQWALQDIAAWLIAAHETSQDNSSGLTFHEAINLAGISSRTAYRLLAVAGITTAT